MKSVIVLLGPPGSGKGTQGEKLSEELGYTRLSTGDMLREAVRNGTELGMKAKSYMDSGALVPNDLIIGLMKEKIAQAKGGVILDGFPRTVEQADALAQQLDVDLALNLDVDDDELAAMIARVRQRVQQRDAVSASADRDGDAPELREPRRNILFDEFDHNYIIYQIRARRKAISGHMRCLGGAYYFPFGQQLRYAKNFRKNLCKTPRKKADGGECRRERV